MHADEAQSYLISRMAATEETPFGPEVLVYKVGGKMFATLGIDDEDGQGRMNLKCDPERAVEFNAYNVEGELDRNLLERMVPPLEHMLRNAVDHGIETAEARRGFGKPDVGQIDIRLSREGGDVMIEIADDGAGNCSTGNQFPDPANPGACTSAFGNSAGKKVPRTSEHQFFFDAELRRPMGSGEWEWFAGASFSHESSKFGQVANFAETGEADVVNARLGMTSDRYSISLWGKNLTGEDSTPLVLRYADGNDSFKRSFVGTLRRDTYWGLTASARF